MWETAFDVSMLKDNNVIVHCPDGDIVGDLMDLLAAQGVKWIGIRDVPSVENSSWEDYREDTCYWIEGTHMMYANTQYTEDTRNEFPDHILCTFYGAEPDIEISDDDFEAVISAKRR